ncbi:MAG: hypothetical protein QF536_10425 [Arenicellales bacterium]|nr:hypothetical protein [Arenicellales bacterium]
MASSSIFTVLSAAATGALLLGVGRTIDPPPPPPPPQAARVKEARLGNVRVLRFFLVDILQKNSLFIEKKKVGNFWEIIDSIMIYLNERLNSYSILTAL